MFDAIENLSVIVVKIVAQWLAQKKETERRFCSLSDLLSGECVIVGFIQFRRSSAHAFKDFKAAIALIVANAPCMGKEA